VLGRSPASRAGTAYDGGGAGQVFDAAGCVAPAAPSCAACLGGPKDTFARMNEPQVCVSTTNRRAAALGF